MGTFVNPTELKARAMVPLLRNMEVPDIDDLFIVPAERLLEEAMNMEFDTDAYPSYWTARFERSPHLITEFQNDMRRAVILTVNRMAVNPHGMASQSVRGFSASYGVKIPEEAKALLRRWGRPKFLYRS